MKKIKSNNKKRTVEIYFILYLAALVLLISKTNRNNDIGNDNIQHKNFDLPFILKAEKPMLTCKVWIDSLGQQCYELDSINYIWNAGEVEDIRYDFVVEDKESLYEISEKLLSDKDFYNKTAKSSEDVFQEQQGQGVACGHLSQGRPLRPFVDEQRRVGQQFREQLLAVAFL